MGTSRQSWPQPAADHELHDSAPTAGMIRWKPGDRPDWHSLDNRLISAGPEPESPVVQQGVTGSCHDSLSAAVRLNPGVGWVCEGWILRRFATA
ncbi:MAG: hypothetical protein A07HR60_00874 [uncultured archaeon A07HR60]|nr:MAG: hypothetical protein A07HR60_00874 [uncultured archaeon A07HR60]